MSAYTGFQSVKEIYKMGEVEIQAFVGVDFTVDKGESVVIAGANSVGKSTILNVPGGMDSPTSGNTFVGGTEISKFSVKRLTTYRCYDIEFVFQFHNLVQNPTVKENVELTTQIRKQPLDIDETIEAIGLRERAPSFPVQLSGGEQQCVAIARALAKNSKLLLCGEPAGAPNYNTGKRVLRPLQDTCRRHGVNIVVITYNLAPIATGDRVIKVRSGKTDSITINEHPLPVEGIEY